MNFLTFLFTTTLLITATMATNCPSEMLQVQDGCLEWNNAESADFSTAEKRCIKKGGSLAGDTAAVLDFVANIQRASYGPLAKPGCYWIGGDLEVLQAQTGLLGRVFASLFSERPDMCPQACLTSNLWLGGLGNCAANFPYICTYDTQSFNPSARKTENSTTPDTATSSKSDEPTKTAGTTPVPNPKESIRRLEFVEQRKNSYVLGSTLHDAPAAVVTMCFRLCRDTKECAMFNYNPVEKWCRTFSRETRVGTNHTSLPDWQIWVGK